VLQPADGPADGEIYVNTMITKYESGGGPVESETLPVRLFVCVCIVFVVSACVVCVCGRCTCAHI
jgi:hypothetical protein